MIATILKVLVRSFVVFVLVSIVWVGALTTLPVPGTPLMLIRKIASLTDLKGILRIKYQWTPAETISDKMLLAVIASEDQFFIDHAGFDVKAIQKAIEHNTKHSQKIRGGSTISQQVAKNVFLWPNRSWIRKALETWFTLLIECFWGKKRIMEVYLNVVELGPGIFGVKAASQYYFKKMPAKLNNFEAASLAAILPNPLKYTVKNPSSYVFRRRNKILLRMFLQDDEQIKKKLWQTKNPKITRKGERND